MKLLNNRWLAFFLISFMAVLGMIVSPEGKTDQDYNPSVPLKSYEEKQWVIKWKGRVDPEFLETVEVMNQQPADGSTQTLLVRLDNKVEEEGWVKRWSAHRNVLFLEPNHKYKVEERGQRVPDPRSKTNFLPRIGAEHAFEYLPHDARYKQEITVAVVDTGVDLSHSFLKPYLVPGVNIKSTGESTQDRMGHGTQVAGVLASVWRGTAKQDPYKDTFHIMPIKVMDDGKDGDVFHTAEGIRKAIERRADVIVLSQGSWTYSDTIADACQAAEKAGVVVVGAAGNAMHDEEGNILYSYPLYYPAALPTVLGVGSVNEQGKHEITSNYGPGIDVVAPGESIRSTKLEGGYVYDSGTSFAAPQVAAGAALILKMYPDWSPEQVRNLIRQTATPMEERWNEADGFGIFNIRDALTKTLVEDIFEPNNTEDTVMPLSLDQQVTAVLAGEEDVDGFRIDVPNEGTLKLSMDHISPALSRVTVKIGDSEEKSYRVESKRTIYVTVPRGSVQVKISSLEKGDRQTPYTFSNSFQPMPDQYENNDYQWNAYQVEVVDAYTVIKGSFHKNQDVDWYQVEIPRTGKLTIHANVFTPRADPVLYVQREGGAKGIKVDEASYGRDETYQFKEVDGTLHLRISDYGANQVAGTYQLLLEYEPILEDEYEPNNHSKQAAPLKANEEVVGAVDYPFDVDWYEFEVSDRQELSTIYFKTDGEKAPLSVIIYDQRLDTVMQWKWKGEKREKLKPALSPGKYYIRVRPPDDQSGRNYRLRMGWR
ncbi:S8 family serine peptidase [Mechercharimyces sp. CAU 1602]|uniref:S8 family peptidase n=1 Tax=Mechercharimyces sp. CAU 1602 TaxID=2973933 RepID=UPI00216382B6|nr:S8 family serine peptidase [Mechercharimyces sp. CAU 1602]